MTSLGNTFQTAREAQGLTLEQMTSRTRIQESHLKALESESFEELPERVFTKGFVLAYARSLGLDGEECLRLFEDCSASFYKKEKENKRMWKMLLHKEDVQKERMSRAMVVLLVGGLLLLGGMVLLQQQLLSRSVFSLFSQQPVEPRDEVVSKPDHANAVVEDRRSFSTAPQDGDSRVVNTEPAPEMDVGTPTPSLSSPDSAPGPASATDSETGPLDLEIRTLDTTWVVIRSDEGKPKEFLLQAGDVVRRQAHDRFLLTLGNAGGIEVLLNGELQDPFGESGAVVRDVELRR